MKNKEKSNDIALNVERSITKKFGHTIFGKFTKAISDYELIKPGDKIAVCISGGKDSMLMAKLFQILKRFYNVSFDIVYLVMDPGYAPQNRLAIENNLKKLEIEAIIFDSDIFNAIDNISNPCFMCAKIRRGTLYSKAKELGCNKIAVGHHFDDIIETNLMSMIYGGQVETMLPKLHSKNFEGMQLIRPLYLIREADIISWAEYNNLEFIRCACHFTETVSQYKEDGELRSKRKEIKELIAKLAKNNPQIEMNIFRSVENINLSKIISYKKDGIITTFLDGYVD